jgi:IS30 family transposase
MYQKTDSCNKAMLDKVEKELNNRPRSGLKFNSPSKILKDEKKIANLR